MRTSVCSWQLQVLSEANLVQRVLEGLAMATKPALLRWWRVRMKACEPVLTWDAVHRVPCRSCRQTRRQTWQTCMCRARERLATAATWTKCRQVQHVFSVFFAAPTAAATRLCFDSASCCANRTPQHPFWASLPTKIIAAVLCQINIERWFTKVKTRRIWLTGGSKAAKAAARCYAPADAGHVAAAGGSAR